MPVRRAHLWTAVTVICAVIVCACAAAPAARADGDPASDVLLSANIFFPYEPASERASATLNRTTAALARLHDRVKVAIIATPSDLGAVSSLFDNPQGYAKFLSVELSYSGPPQLLVVMPNGYGTSHLSGAAIAAVSRLPRPASANATRLVQAAISAEVQIARADGHSILSALRSPPPRHAPASAAATQHRAHSPVRLILVILLGAFAVAGAVVLLLGTLRAHHAES